MSQADSFKSRIIDVARGAPVSSPRSNGKANGHHGSYSPGRTTQPLEAVLEPPPRRTTQRIEVALEPPPRREVITTLALSSPIYVMEEVPPEALSDPRLSVLLEPGSARARSFRLLQHRLFAQHDPRIVTVSSACPGEGKTTCAANLALAMSEAPFSRVLLLDLNLTRPGVSDLFRFDPADNLLTKLLRSEDTAAPYGVASLSGSRLQLAALPPEIAAGKCLDRSLLGSLLHALRSAYDYIVIDAASAQDGADANVASECADAVVLSTLAGKSSKVRLRRAMEQLQPANVVGAVLLDS
jgi:Mrp family chromosome partitioning ATPase